MRWRVAISLLVPLLLAAPAAAQERGLIANMGSCSARAPRLWLALDAATATDCATGSGSSQVLCLCAGGAWSALGTALLPSHLAAYSPDRPPTSCATCDEFDGSFTQTWAWVNQGTSTDSSSLSAAAIVVSGASAGVTARAVALPASDFTVTTKLHVGSQASAGIALLYSGTNASPTGFVELVTDWNGSNETLRILAMTLTGINTWSSTEHTSGTYGRGYLPIYMQARYTYASKALAWFVGFDGINWRASGTKTLAAHPSYAWRVRGATGDVYWDWFRIRTDASRNLAGE